MSLIRGLPVLGLCFLFALTAYSGANILAFEALAHRIWFAAGGPPLSSVLDSVSAWASATTVAVSARSLMVDLLLVETPADHAAVESALIELAAISPTSTVTWQALADVRKAQDTPMESVLAAFRMSALTGSHEGYAMMRRAIFGLGHWTELPEQDRQTVVRDLITTVENGDPRNRYRRILEAKAQIERDSIKAAILASGLATKDLLEALGV